MGKVRTGFIPLDLFSMASLREPFAPLDPKSSSPMSVSASTASPARHILPCDLPAALRHLDDGELDQLQAAVTAEQQRRGRKPPAPEKTVSKRTEAPALTLRIGKLNAIRAALKAGVTPAKIAKQFGIPQADVRKVFANEKMK
jgi:hypothetical protein